MPTPACRCRLPIAIIAACLLGGSAALAQSPSEDLHSLRWFVHEDLLTAQRPLAFYQELVARSTAQANVMLQGATGPADQPCCTALDDVSVQAFSDVSPGRDLLVIDTSEELDDLDAIGGAGSRAFIVQTLGYCSGAPGESPIGCADTPVCNANADDDPDLVLVVTMDALDQFDAFASTLAHERGHNACLCHTDEPSCPNYDGGFSCSLMKSSSGGACIKSDECTDYREARTGGDTGAVCECFASDEVVAPDGAGCSAGLCSGGICDAVGSAASTQVFVAGGTVRQLGDTIDDPLVLSGRTGGWTDRGRFGMGLEPTGMAHAPARGITFGVAPTGGADLLFTVDPDDGSVTVVGSVLDGGSPVAGLVNLAFDPGATDAPGDDRLLALGPEDLATLHAIDPDSGSADALGRLNLGVEGGGVAFPGLAYDADNRRLFASSSIGLAGDAGLFEIDYACPGSTCATGPVEGIDLPRFESGLAWSAASGDLLLVGYQNGPRTLYDTIDATTLEPGLSLQVQGFSTGAVAALPVPEPTGGASLGAAVLALAACAAAAARRRHTA
ncbi:MAG: hypothetical protein QNK03_16940 [Myxococcota bacterium]|nr:hypothetical protein [Myxococcota bacterium]